MSLLSVFSKMMRRADLMEAMIERLGLREAIDRRPHSHDVMRRAANRCMQCTESEECEQWLDNHPGPAEHAPAYCRNADMFERLTIEIEKERAREERQSALLH